MKDKEKARMEIGVCSMTSVYTSEGSRLLSVERCSAHVYLYSSLREDTYLSLSLRLLPLTS